MGCSQKINSEARLPGRPGCVKKTAGAFRVRAAFAPGASVAERSWALGVWIDLPYPSCYGLRLT